MLSKVDFWVRVAAPVMTFLAVLAALFRDWFQAKFFPPLLFLRLLDHRGTDLTPEFSYIVVDEKPVPTASRWYHVEVSNRRRYISPAADIQVVLREVGIPNSVGAFIWQSAGDVPLPVRHGALRPGRTLGRPLECDLCNVFQRSTTAEGAPPIFGLAIPVPVTNLPRQRTQPFRMAVRLQGRSIEADSNVLTLEIAWDGQWAHDAAQMANHLVICPVVDPNRDPAEYRPRPSWFERNAGLGGWIGSVGTVVAILAAWWLAHQEYLRAVKIANDRTNSEIALISRTANEFDKLVQDYVRAAKSGDLADNGFYNAHINDAEFHRVDDLNNMPITQWPTVASYDAFKQFVFAGVKLLESSSDRPMSQEIFESRLKSYQGTLQNVQGTLNAARR